jgi:putative ABC transport system permease protein
VTILYQLLVRLAFPVRVRRRFGADMVRMFERQLTEARAAGAPVLPLWMSAVADVCVEGLGERLAVVMETRRAAGRELGRWRWWMHAWIRDARYAVRLLVRQPGVTIVALLTLAIGIGGNTAIFSAVDAVLLRPLPYRDPDRLVKVWEKRTAEGVLDNVVAPADFLDWARMNTVFEDMAAYMAMTADLTGTGEPVRLFAAGVSPPFFEVLRVQPAFGRTFRREEATPGQHRVVVLGHGLWQARFGSDPGAVGRTIALNGVPHEIVGVLPSDFEFPDPAIELWAPMPLSGGSTPPTRSNHSLEVFARMKPGVTIDAARADMDRIGALLQKDYPDTNRTHGVYVRPLAEDLARHVRSGLLMLLAAVGFVLLIACVNVANLLLVRAAARRREMAVRAALGAGRGRLAGQALTESVLLGLAGGAAGLAVAYWAIGLLRRLMPAGLPVFGLQHLALDRRMLLFTFLISILTGLLFGLLPAWHIAREDVNESLKEGGRLPGNVRRRLRTALVIGEIAVASLLLVGAGLTLRSFQRLLNVGAGFEIAGRTTALVTLPGRKYADDLTRLEALAEVEGRFAAIPGVRSVGATSRLPLGNENSRTGVAIEGREPVPDVPTRAHIRAVTAGFFEAMGMTLVSGRPFAASDHEKSMPVAIVNRTMAERYWPGASPVGRRVRMGGTQEWREVVGVLADARNWGLDRPVNPEMYLPIRQLPWTTVFFVVATDPASASPAAAMREALRAVDPDLPLSSVRTMDEVARVSTAARRSTMILLSVFGALALVLAAAGIYGVMAHLVALRTAEIGVRMTLGATPASVLGLVLREGTLQALAGLAIGLSGAVLLMRSMRALLFEVGPADPLTLAGVAVILAATSVLTCYLPARRAMLVDPVKALRQS